MFVVWPTIPVKQSSRLWNDAWNSCPWLVLQWILQGQFTYLPTLGREGKCVTLNIVRIKCNFLYMHMVLLQALLFIQGIQSSTQTDFWWANEFAKDLRWVIFCTRHKLITLLSWWAVFMGPAVDSRIELLDVGILVLKIDSEVRAAEHNSKFGICSCVLKEKWKWKIVHYMERQKIKNKISPSEERSPQSLPVNCIP